MRLDQLRLGRAHPRRYRNRRLGEFLKELKFTEGRSTGIPKILEAMARNGSHPLEFEFDADCSYFMVRLLVHPTAVEVANSVQNDQLDATAGTRSAPSRRQVEILQQCGQERTLADLMAYSGRTDRTKFRNQVIRPLLLSGLLEMTIPDKPTSSKQRYRLTEKGRALLATLATSAP